MKWAYALMGCAALTAFVAPPALAQEDEDKECECRRTWRVEVFPRSGDRFPEAIWLRNRARLGVLVDTRENEETDRYGARIERVTGGGPADKAGIRAGDVITKLDGVSLVDGAPDVDEGESAPGYYLIELAGELERGDTIEVEFRRDGATQTVELVAGDFDGSAFEGPGELDFEELPPRIHGLMERLRDLPEVTFRGPESFALRLGAGIPGLELVSLNPDLGEYFGTDEGVLVVSMPEDSELNLKAGDVIKAIDGREVRSPSHTMRILRSYDPEEEVEFEVLRKKRTVTVKGVVPELLGGGPYKIERPED